MVEIISVFRLASNRHPPRVLPNERQNNTMRWEAMTLILTALLD